MLILVGCPQCLVDEGKPNIAGMRMLPITESGTVELVCDRDHRTCTVIQAAKFEVLSHLAIGAVYDGNYRQAVSDFASMLERLYEYYFKATCRKRGIEKAAVEQLWKRVGKQSERQLGVFVATHLCEQETVPKLLSDNMVSLRNDVTHGGLLADRHDALRFGQAVLDCAVPIVELLKQKSYQDAVWGTTLDEIGKRAAPAVARGERIQTFNFKTVLSLSHNQKQLSVEEAVADYGKWTEAEKAMLTVRPGDHIWKQ